MAGRRCARVPSARHRLHLRDPGRTPRAGLPGGTSAGPADGGGHLAVAPVGSGLRRVQPDDRSPFRGAVGSIPLALGASGWGMFIRSRRQLLLSLRERALRAEADQELHEEQARVAEPNRIAREMHDVLAHRISLLALHAGGLEMRPKCPPDQVRAGATLLRATARQALEEFRTVIGVLREATGHEPAPATPQPTLRDIVVSSRRPEPPVPTSTSRCRSSASTTCRRRWAAMPTGSSRRLSQMSASTPAAARARVRITRGP